MKEIDFWSERPGSNRRPSAWKADALPTELLPRQLISLENLSWKVNQLFSEMIPDLP